MSRETAWFSQYASFEIQGPPDGWCGNINIPDRIFATEVHPVSTGENDFNIPNWGKLHFTFETSPRPHLELDPKDLPPQTHVYTPGKIRLKSDGLDGLPQTQALVGIFKMDTGLSVTDFKGKNLFNEPILITPPPWITIEKQESLWGKPIETETVHDTVRLMTIQRVDMIGISNFLAVELGKKPELAPTRVTLKVVPATRRFY